MNRLYYPETLKDTNGQVSQVVRLSTWKIMQWNLVTHAGYMTCQHKDANGLCTWIYAHVGVKIWAIIRPKYTAEHRTVRKVDNLHKSILDCGEDELDQHDVATVFLSAGELL
jgi:hypothetical protein